MRKEGVWLFSILFGATGVFTFSLPLWPIFKNVPINIAFICIIGILGYVIIFLYSSYKLNNQDSQNYSKFNDRDKILDIMEDQKELEKHAKNCIYYAQKPYLRMKEFGTSISKNKEKKKMNINMEELFYKWFYNTTFHVQTNSNGEELFSYEDIENAFKAGFNMREASKKEDFLKKVADLFEEYNK